RPAANRRARGARPGVRLHRPVGCRFVSHAVPARAATARVAKPDHGAAGATTRVRIGSSLISSRSSGRSGIDGTISTFARITTGETAGSISRVAAVTVAWPMMSLEIVTRTGNTRARSAKRYGGADRSDARMYCAEALPSFVL